MPIKEGRYRVAGNLLVNGVSTPWYDMAVDINVYSMASMITAHAPIYPLDGTYDLSKVPDYGAMAQKGLVTLAAQASYLDTSGSQVPVQMFNLETGYIDEITDTYDANEVEFVGRSSASVFQDARMAAAPGTPGQSSQLRGDQLATMLFAKRGISSPPGNITKSPSQYIGKAYDESTYVKAYRARSEWDELTDASLQDGFVCWIHNGVGYYGPPAQSVPTYALAWGKDLLGCSINHVARRSHNISVRIDSYVKHLEQKASATYPPGVNNPSETFRFFISGLDAGKVRARAKQVWQELVTREFIVRLRLIPDANLLRFIAQNGANWTFTLGGVRRSEGLLYHCRQVSIKMEAGSDEPTLSIEIVGANHVAQVGQYQ